MTKENAFKFAREQGYHLILEAIHSHKPKTLADLVLATGAKERTLSLELTVMRSLGLLQLGQKTDGAYYYGVTNWGLEFLQEYNKEKGLTFTCLLCGTTTGIPHVCPVFYP